MQIGYLLGDPMNIARTPGMLAFCVSAAALAADAPPLFPDPALEAAVRSHVFGKRDNKEPLTADDVKNLSGLKASGKGIGSLAGLEQCASLMSLDLAGGEISDLGPIKALTNLQSITLSNNKIASLAPLAGMSRLQYLELTGNQVADLGSLAQLTTLNSLYLSNNKIQDLKPLSGLTKLWSLYLDGNQVAGLSPLGALKNLASLDLRRNKVKDLSPLAPLNSLHYLMLEGNAITDLTSLIAFCKKDADGEKRFAPYLMVYLTGNPLSAAAKKTQIADLKKVVHTVTFEAK